jgi:hypothetical protein
MSTHRVATAAILLFAASAVGANSAFDPLTADVAARATSGGLTPAQSAALAKVESRLARRTTGAAAAVATALAADRILERAFPGDAVFGADLDAALSTLTDDARARRDDLATVLDDLPDGRGRSHGTRRLAAADAALGRLASDAGRVAELFDLCAALRAVDAGTRAAVGAGNWLVARVNGEPFVAKSTQLLVTKDDRGGYDVVALGYDASLREVHDTITLRLDSVAAAGTFPLDSIERAGAFSVTFGPAGAVTFSVDTGPTHDGTVALTTFDPTAKFVEGTFAFVASDGAVDVHPVTGGRFHLRRR